MRVKRVLAWVLVGLVPAGVARADTCSITPTYTYYSVVGSSTEELEQSLKQRGPRDDSGAGRFAYTDWTVKWNWKKLDNDTIDPASVTLTCVVNILLPKAESQADWSPELSKAWESFVERTRQHELNHVGHVEQLVPQIPERFARAAERNGALSTKQAESIVTGVIAKIRAKDREYDAVTSHGRTEGTWRISP
jgi:predicted secreted Zn-dependent protease